MRKYTHHHVQVRCQADLNKHKIIIGAKDSAVWVVLHVEYSVKHIHEGQIVLRQPLGNCFAEREYDSQWIFAGKA